jgi:hypothetical protein
MEKVKVTKEQVFLFQKNAEVYLDQHANIRDHFTHALARVLKGIKTLIDDYNDDAQAIRLTHTTIDKENRNTITPDKQKLVAKETRDLLQEIVEAPQYIATTVPKDLGHLEWSVFYPFVLKDEFPPEESTVPKAP